MKSNFPFFFLMLVFVAILMPQIARAGFLDFGNKETPFTAINAFLETHKADTLGAVIEDLSKWYELEFNDNIQLSPEQEKVKESLKQVINLTKLNDIQDCTLDSLKILLDVTQPMKLKLTSKPKNLIEELVYSFMEQVDRWCSKEFIEKYLHLIQFEIKKYHVGTVKLLREDTKNYWTLKMRYAKSLDTEAFLSDRSLISKFNIEVDYMDQSMAFESCTKFNAVLGGNYKGAEEYSKAMGKEWTKVDNFLGHWSDYQSCILDLKALKS